MLNQVSFSIPESLREEFLNDLRSLKSKLNLPENLPVAGKSRQNMGQASKGYILDCMTEAKNAPQVPSGLFNMAEMESDWQLVAQLDPILAELVPLTNTLVNLRQLAGQDLMAAGNQIKRGFNEAARENAQFKAASDRLKKRYELTARSKETTEPADVGAN